MLENKLRDYQRAQGQPIQVPKFKVESNYVEPGGLKLAVVRIRSPQIANQVYIYGIKGAALLRVSCLRTAQFDQDIPLFYGPCGEKVREVFGIVNIPR